MSRKRWTGAAFKMTAHLQVPASTADLLFEVYGRKRKSEVRVADHFFDDDWRDLNQNLTDELAARDATTAQRKVSEALDISVSEAKLAIDWLQEKMNSGLLSEAESLKQRDEQAAGMGDE